MQNLKDKLLQAGLIPKDYRAGETPEQRTARLNREQLEKRAKVAEIAKAAALKTAIGPHTFFFTTRSKKLRRLVIDDEVRLALEKGQLAVVEWPDHTAFPWAVVSREAAEKVLEIDTEALRFYVRSEKEQFGVEPSR